MKYYCMCKITGRVPSQALDSQGFGPLDNQCYSALNRYGPVFEGQKHRSVFLGQPMKMIVMGAQQRIAFNAEGKVDRPPRNEWVKTKEEAEADLGRLRDSKEHYPAVDVYRCPNCGAEIIVEG